MSTIAAVNVNEDHERLLRLAAHEREMRISPQWKTDTQDACELHGEAVEALFNELYRQLDARAKIGSKVAAAEQAPNIRRELQREMKAALRRELPDMINNLIESL